MRSTRVVPWGLAVIGLLVVALVAPVTAAEGFQGAPETPGSGYYVESPFIRDKQGRARFFHGVNAVWKLDPYYPPSTLFGTEKSKSYFDARDARFLVRSGLNSVRLGVLFAGVEPKHNEYDNSYLRKTRRITDLLAKHGVTVMVDFHQDMYHERFDGEGFPTWAVKDDDVPATNCCGFPGNYFTPAVRRTFDNLWDNKDGLWDEYRDAWIHTVARFKDAKNLIGYDLLNEPWPGSQAETCANPEGCPVFDTEKLQPFFEHVMAGIREEDPNGIIWWDANVITNSGAKNNVGLNNPIDPSENQGISFHVYCIAGSPSTGIRPGDDPSCGQSQPIAFNNQDAAAERNQSSLFLTEFGASDDVRDIRRVARLSDQHMVSWHYWHYGEWKDPTTTGTGGAQGLFEDDLDRPDTLKKRKARVLIRTYPQAVAGDPTRFRFRPYSERRRFKLVYKADPTIAAPTVVYVPVKRHYRGDYDVEIEGPAKVVSRNNSRFLKLDNTGAGKVVVKVARPRAE